MDMDVQMRGVEGVLGGLGMRCNARLVGRMGENFAGLQQEERRSCMLLPQPSSQRIYSWNTAHDRHALAAQLALLTTTPTIITRILSQKGSLLLAAKLLLLSRLVHKTLSAYPSDTPPLVHTLRDRLASLRTKLLRAIDMRFADPARDVHDLVQDMCAFALATSSAPSEVLAHFLKVRRGAMVWHLERDDGVKEHAVKGMELLLETLRGAQVVFPRRLSEAMGRLKDAPLIRQADVMGATELRLRIHTRHLPDELRNYTPWPRHDELVKSEADRILRSWAKSAQKGFIAGLRTSLGKVGSFDEVLEVRQRLFETWPWSARGLLGLHSADVVDEMREVLNARLNGLIEADVAGLERVCEATAALLEGDAAMPQPSLWSEEMTNLDASNGGERFKSALLRSYNGIDTTTSAPILAFDEWVAGVKRIQADIKRMRDTHWDGDLGDEDSDDEMDSKQTLLSEDDPRALDEHLTTSLATGSTHLTTRFSELIKRHADTEEQGSDASLPRVISLLRILREISRRAASLDAKIAQVIAPLTLPGLTQPLHVALGASISQIAVRHLWTSLPRFKVVGRQLWESKPPLPNMPSVLAFKLLRAVSRRMEEVGRDLWSPILVGSVKWAVGVVVAREFGQYLERLDGGEGMGKREVARDEDTAKTMETIDDVVKDTESTFKAYRTTQQSTGTDEEKKERLIQLIFDLSYLSAALQQQNKELREKSPILSVLEKAVEAAGLEEREVERLRRGGSEYWRRGYLMFGLLAAV